MKEICETHIAKTLRNSIDTIIEEIREISVGVSVLNRANFKWDEYKKYCYERLKEAFLIEQETYKLQKYREEKKVH